MELINFLPVLIKMLLLCYFNIKNSDHIFLISYFSLKAILLGTALYLFSVNVDILKLSRKLYYFFIIFLIFCDILGDVITENNIHNSFISIS